MDPTIRRHFFSLFLLTFPALVSCFRHYEKNLITVKKKKLQLKFLQDCVHEQVIPTSFLPFFRWKTTPFPDVARATLLEHIALLKREIDEVYWNLRCNLRLLQGNIQGDLLDSVLQTARNKCNIEVNKISVRLNRVLQDLCNRSEWNNCGLSGSVLNLSSYVLSEIEKQVLQLGFSFALKPGKDIALDFVSSVCNGRFNFPCLNGFIINGFLDHFNSYDSIPRRFRCALENLKKNNSIFITKADKSNTVVIIDKVKYEEKMIDMLSDATTYEKLRSSPLQRLSTQFNRTVKQLLNNVPNIDAKLFMQINPKLPHIYGLPKTHKDNIPLRPIVSYCGSFSYKLSKFLASKLAPLVGCISDSHIKNSSHFIEKIKSLSLANGKMLSFDVDSLFTKVPLDDVLTFLSRKLPSYNLDLGMPVTTFIDLIRLCVSSNAFSFGDTFFFQRFGNAMGSPLSPILSNLYMEYYESELLPSIAPQNLLWYRYVDDIFSFWPDTLNNFDVFFGKLNDLVPSINFKIEWEKNNSLPFLDILVTRLNDLPIFAVYRKPTHCDMYIHYFSYHNDAIKLSVISTLFLRALRICSPQCINEENSKIWAIFRKLKYPDCFIKKGYFKARKTYYVPKSQPTKKRPYLCLPYVKSLESIQSVSRELDVNIAFKYTSSIKSLLVKNNSIVNSQAGVYKIPCKDCDLVYIGETGRSLDVRLKEHKRDVSKYNVNNANFVHAWDQNHSIDWNSSKMIIKCNNFKKRRILESVCIQYHNTFNLNQGMFKLDPLMSTLVVKSLPGITGDGQVRSGVGGGGAAGTRPGGG